MTGWADTTDFLFLPNGELPPEVRADSLGCFTGDRLLKVRYIELSILGPFDLLPLAWSPLDRFEPSGLGDPFVLFRFWGSSAS